MPTLKPLLIKYTKGQLFRHIDGGYYKFQKSVLFADDQDELVIYRHVWPFQPSDWARRSNEFVERFTPITKDDLIEAKKEKRKDLQERIENQRNMRRAAKELGK